MKILLITIFFVGFMVSEIPRVSVFGYFPLIKIKSIINKHKGSDNIKYDSN